MLFGAGSLALLHPVYMGQLQAHIERAILVLDTGSRVPHNLGVTFTTHKGIPMTNTTNTHNTDCRFLSGSGWCCNIDCATHGSLATHRARPVLPMTVQFGNVVAAFATHNPTTGEAAVEVWCQSPTGGQSDSLQFTIPCRNIPQAESVAAMWRAMWNLPTYGQSNLSDHGTGTIPTDIDGIPSQREEGGSIPVV